jgi:hypothetical protein
MTTTKIEQLEKKIDELIRTHIAEVRRTAAAAMERAFASVAVKKTPVRKTAPSRAVAGSEPNRRRDPEVIQELVARLHQAVCAKPGSSMPALAKSIGKTTAELEHPLRLLKSTGKVRIVGERHGARYFPLAKST